MSEKQINQVNQLYDKLINQNEVWYKELMDILHFSYEDCNIYDCDSNTVDINKMCGKKLIYAFYIRSEAYEYVTFPLYARIFLGRDNLRDKYPKTYAWLCDIYEPIKVGVVGTTQIYSDDIKFLKDNGYMN